MTKLEFMRREKNITQKQMAELCEVHENILALFESRMKQPEAKFREISCDIFEMHESELYENGWPIIAVLSN